jgi:hypothetical protein
LICRSCTAATPGRDQLTTRRDAVPFDPYHFERLAREGVKHSARQAFDYIYRSHHWAGKESVSGEGASQDQIAHLQMVLPELLLQLGTRTLLDLPCGDYNWMRHLTLPVDQYIGADLLPQLVAEHQDRFSDQRHRFVALDLTIDVLPRADLILCRDCWVHLSFDDIARSIANVRRSGIVYLLTTTFPKHDANEDIVTGDWRLLNLQKPPFSFPAPLQLINEQCSEGGGLFSDKSLGLWPVKQLPAMDAAT